MRRAKSYAFRWLRKARGVFSYRNEAGITKVNLPGSQQPMIGVASDGGAWVFLCAKTTAGLEVVTLIWSDEVKFTEG